jgi:hypothetical protein
MQQRIRASAWFPGVDLTVSRLFLGGNLGGFGSDGAGCFVGFMPCFCLLFPSQADAPPPPWFDFRARWFRRSSLVVRLTVRFVQMNGWICRNVNAMSAAVKTFRIELLGWTGTCAVHATSIRFPLLVSSEPFICDFFFN